MLQKHNFPINYTLRVQAYELFRLSNISRMVTKRLSSCCSSHLAAAKHALFSPQRSQVEALLLQRLWFQVNQGVLKKVEPLCPAARCSRRTRLPFGFPFQIIRVLPERHPSRSYAAELERRFRDAEGVFVQSHPVEVGSGRTVCSGEQTRLLSEAGPSGEGTGSSITARCHIDPIYRNWGGMAAQLTTECD